MAASDHADCVHAQWRAELPELALEGASILARAERIARAAARRIDAVLAKHGLEAGEFDVLCALRRAGSPYRLRPTEIYRALMISSGGLTDRLGRLERAGLVRRIAAQQDKRSLLVELTETGRARMEAALREHAMLQNRLVSCLDGAERQTLERLLRKLAIALEHRA